MQRALSSKMVKPFFPIPAINRYYGSGFNASYSSIGGSVYYIDWNSNVGTLAHSYFLTIEGNYKVRIAFSGGFAETVHGTITITQWTEAAASVVLKNAVACNLTIATASRVSFIEVDFTTTVKNALIDIVWLKTTADGHAGSNFLIQGVGVTPY